MHPGRLLDGLIRLMPNGRIISQNCNVRRLTRCYPLSLERKKPAKMKLHAGSGKFSGLLEWASGGAVSFTLSPEGGHLCGIAQRRIWRTVSLQLAERNSERLVALTERSFTMNKSFKFSVAMLFMLTTLLSGCIVPGEWRDHGGDQGDRGGDQGESR